MPDPILDRAAIIEATAKARKPYLWDGSLASKLATLSIFTDEQAEASAEKKRAELREAIAATLPLIAAAILAPLRDRHRLCECAYCRDKGSHVCAGCSSSWPCADSALLDAIEAAVKGGE